MYKKDNLFTSYNFADLYFNFIVRDKIINEYVNTTSSLLNDYDKHSLDLYFADLLNNGVYVSFKRSMIYFNTCNLLQEDFNNDIYKLNQSYVIYKNFSITLFDFLICRRKYYSFLAKTYRLKKRLLNYFDKYTDNLVFVTLTFSDKTLLNSSYESRRTYVRKFLKSNCKDYVANVDFGAINEREHYHAVCTNDIDFNGWYKYGGLFVERIVVKNAGALAHYIDKLVNHAYKVCTGLSTRLIYSRKS